MSRYDKSLLSPQLMLKICAWRYPFLMVDRIADFSPTAKGAPVVAVKNCTFNEPYVPGHFPDNPIVPGVLMAEMLGQASEYSTILHSFCLAYQEKFDVELKRFDDIAKALRTHDGANLLLELRNQVYGCLASQELKYRHFVIPGDVIYLHCELAFADVHGFHHYNVEARVGRHVACSGKLINYRNTREKALQAGFVIPEDIGFGGSATSYTA